MNELFKVVLSLSLSGSLLILALLAARPLTRQFGRRWQYYIWLVVAARLLLPFGPPESPVGSLFRREVPAPPEVLAAPLLDQALGTTAPGEPAPPEGAAASEGFSAAGLAGAVGQNLGLIWLGTAALLAVRKATRYQSFLRCARAASREVSDPELLDRLARAGEEVGVRRPVELAVNPLLASPMLVGLFRPRILLPGGLSDEDFDWTVRHELVHCRRWDIAYKWLVQATACVHWFNPLVWWMARETGRACELACDEAVTRDLGPEGRRAYGDMLLRAAGTGGELLPAGAAPLNQGGKLLKERLVAIMEEKKRGKWAAALSVAAAVAVMAGGTVAGAYSGPAGEEPAPSPKAETRGEPSIYTSTPIGGSSLAARAEQFYQAGSFPLFHSVFPRLDRADQEDWLEKFYTGDDLAFFAGSVKGLEESDPLIAAFAERAYQDDNIVFFSTVADSMDQTTLEGWLDRALEDQKTTFQSVLYDRLGKEEENDRPEKELEEQQMAKYRALGLTREGKRWYYQGQPVHILLDLRPNKSFYSLDIDPLGTVSVEVLRDEENNITGVSLMTREEVDRWHRDWGWDIQDRWEDAQEQWEEAQDRLEDAQARLDDAQARLDRP